MSLAARTVFVLVLLFVAGAVYALKYGNLGLVRDGCNGALVGLPQDGTLHFKAFPPHYVCRYRLKHGRVVERSE